MNFSRSHTTAAAFAAFVLLAPAAALAEVTVTPVVSATGRAMDNTGRRTEDQKPQSDVTTSASAGGQVLWSNPTAAVRLSALGEYERYLSAAVKNTYATGGLDGAWRPDERTNVRSAFNASYAPDRYDPRVPYRIAIASPDGSELPPFVRATTTRFTGSTRMERWLSEYTRGRVIGAYSSTRYTDRQTVGDQPTAIEPRQLQGRNVAEVGVEGLRKVTEIGAAGLYSRYANADYEAGPTAHTFESGALTEWAVEERWTFRATAGANYTRVPGEDGVPTRLGWTGEMALIRAYQRGSLELRGKEGHSFTSGAIPAANRREARLAGTFLPYEVLETSAWAGAAREKSLFAAYRATGTVDIYSAGASLGFRATESLTFKLGYEHNRLKSTGLAALPYQSNTVFFGFTFIGGPIGDAPAGSRYPPAP